MNELLKVKKWGGENAAELELSPQNVVKDFREGIKQAVVVSAIRAPEIKKGTVIIPEFNTTDKLIKIGELLNRQIVNERDILLKVLELREFHLKIVKEKINDTNQSLINEVDDVFEKFENDIIYYMRSDKKIIPTEKNDYSISTNTGSLSILGFGEELSAKVQAIVINNLGEDGLEAEVVNLEGVFDDVEKKKTDSELYSKLSNNISNKVDSILINGKVAIVPGYISGSPNGIENMVGRGYSDATAAMTAVGLSGKNEVILEIQKSVDGMMSADPRLLRGINAKLIEEIDYITAKEITGVRGAQAKLLHSQVLRRQLQVAGIKLHLFDPFRNTKGTVITKNKSETSSGVEYIGARKNIIFFSISSGHMEGSGILANIFDIVKNYKPVDIVSTSETEVTFTIDNDISDDLLFEIQEKIRIKLAFDKDDERNKVEYTKSKALVFCVGQNLSNSMGTLARAATCFEKGGINVELVSQGAKERAMVFGIEGAQMKEAVNLLHKEFID